MKTILPTLALTLCLTMLSNQANAQWNLFADLLSQMDEGTNQFYANNLDSLNENWVPNFDPNNELFNLLNGNLLDSVPPGNLDGSYQNDLNAGLDSLIAHLPGFDLSGPDEDTLLGELDWINGIFGNNNASLGGIFGNYQDSLSFDSMNWDVTILGFDSLNNQNYQVLEDSANGALDLSDPNGPHDFANILDQLFDVNLFPDLELAFGTLNADLRYWGYDYSERAKVARIGSVPRFDKRVFNNNGQLPTFPIEARWHVMVSWMDNPAPNGSTDTNPNGEASGGKFNPLLFSGDYALMATPGIGSWGKTTFRLITSLGTEFGTYAPSHSGINQPFSSVNKGYMTGVGAQAGAGFAFTTGDLTVYSIGTFAQGQALRCPKPYPYTSRRYEVGMRYGNYVNVRYSSGFTSWQSDNNRVADVKNQFTIGIILPELHH